MATSLTTLLKDTRAGLDLALLVGDYREAAALAQRMQTLSTLLARAQDRALSGIRR